MKLGIIGAGGIAGIVAPTLMQIKEIDCYAIASRSLEKAEQFAEKRIYANGRNCLCDGING